MRVVNLKQRYWIGLGVVLGLSVGAWQQSVNPADDLEMRRPLQESVLVAALEAVQSRGDPAVTNLIVYPARDGNNYVTGYVLTPTPAGLTDKPFFSNVTKASITSLLAQAAARNPRLTYRYAWWRSPAIVLMGWTIGCTLFVGFLWPLAYRLIAGVDESTPEISLWELLTMNFGVKKKDKKETPSLGAFGAGADEPERTKPPAVIEAPAAPVAVLEAQALSALPAEVEGEKHYEGEFYPVVHPDAPKKPFR